MSADFDLQSVEVSEVVEGVAAMLLAPIVLPLASAINQPLVKNALKKRVLPFLNVARKPSLMPRND